MNLISEELESNKTCGIIGVVSKTSTPQILFEGLTILQNRGYDSAGIVTYGKDKNELIVSKYASINKTDDALALLKNDLGKHESNSIGIGHTRWATHGPRTDENAHPHCDYKRRIALVHNGVIENYSELKKMILEENKEVKFLSQTDTEVVAQLIGYFLDKEFGVFESIRKAVSKLEGTWGLVILSKLEPDKLFVCRNGSPMLVGISENRVFVSSESAAFVKYTREMFSLKNQEIVVLSMNGVENIEVKSRIELAEKEEIELSPHPYPHWTLKEIIEQPQTLHRSLNYGGRLEDEFNVKLGGLEVNSQWLTEIKHLVIIACGTSYYAGLYGAKIFRYLRSFDTVRVIDADDFDVSDIPPNKPGVLAISQSGETRDVINVLNVCQENNVPIFSIVNRVGSLVARTTSCGVYINAGRETGVASTKAFTSQVTVLSLVGIWFAQHRRLSAQLRKKIILSLHKLPTTFGMIQRKVRPKCVKVAQYLKNFDSLFVLGRGIGESIAKEGALKIKEITYTHAEAYSAGSLKHGPFALINKGTPIIILIFDDRFFNKNITCIQEVKARYAYVIAISDCCDRISDDIVDIKIQVPSNDKMTYLNGVMPLQFIAYELSVLKGINPDKPKNLAKTVTVV